jgi:two-component system chemotaxis response regulator CheY
MSRIALIVDDSKTMRLIVGRTVKSLGLTIIEAGDGQEALDLLGDQVPELALIDWNMPVMTGPELIKRLRARPEFSDLKILMISTETGSDAIVRALELGVDDYLMKPFSPEALTTKLDTLGFSAED